MMKKLLLVLIIAQSLVFVCHGEQEIRGLWAATVYGLDFPSSPTADPKILREELRGLAELAEAHGFNAIFFQVRPGCDALYPSQLFPWSQWLTGRQGQAPEDDFDPLACLIKESHDRGIAVHAWINPLRITCQKADSKANSLSSLSEQNPARIHPEYTVFHRDGCLYWDPGFPETRQLVLEGVRELLRNYPLDGIHYDDYFYPGRDFEDQVSFSFYGDGQSRSDFRLGAVNALIADTQAAVQALRPNALFGVSPAGVWANRDTDPRGSNTHGQQSKYDHYADSLTWMEQGWIDYIAPQLYWPIGSREADFETLLDWWSRQARRTGTRLLIGLAGYRTAQAREEDIWQGPWELQRQLALLKKSARGYLLFRAGSLRQSPDVAACFSEDPPRSLPPDGPGPYALGFPVVVRSQPGRTATLALWRGSTALLTADHPGSGSGILRPGTAGRGPVLFLRFQGPVLQISRSSGSLEVLPPAELLSAEDRFGGPGEEALILHLSRTVAPRLKQQDGRLVLDIPGQTVPLLFESALFSRVECVRQPWGVRYLLTPRRSAQQWLLIPGEKALTLSVKGGF